MDMATLACATATASSITKFVQEFTDNEVKREAKSALNEKNEETNVRRGGVEIVLNWLRTKVADFFGNQLQHIPAVAKWAPERGILFAVVKKMCDFFLAAVHEKQVWAKAHQSAMLALNENKSKDLLHAYGKKMACYFLEIIVQCLVLAIKANGFEISEEEKKDITEMLDNILP